MTLLVSRKLPAPTAELLRRTRVHDQQEHRMCDEHVIQQDLTLVPAPGSRLSRRNLLRVAGIAGVGLTAVGAAAVPASAAVSQNGWGAITSSSSSALDRGFAVAGVSFPGGVRRGYPETILSYVAGQVHRHVEALHPGWCWGWSYREIRGGGALSNHASATAIDINAPRHPIGAVGTFSAAQRRTIHSIVAYCEGVVRWGGDYSGRKDEMHFELNRGPGDPAVARIAHKVGGGAAPPPPPPAPASGWPTLTTGSRGFQVTAL